MRFLKFLTAAILGWALGFGIEQLDPQAPDKLWFALGLPLTEHLLDLIEHILLRWLRQQTHNTSAMLVRLLLDLGAGGVTGILLGELTTAPVLEAAGLASAMLFMQTLIVDKLLIGNAVGDLVVNLFERGLPPEPQFSLASAHAARGDYQAATAEFERNIALMPGDPRPLLALARMQRFEQRDPGSALATLERVLQLRSLPPALRQQATREIAELRVRIASS